MKKEKPTIGSFEHLVQASGPLDAVSEISGDDSPGVGSRGGGGDSLWPRGSPDAVDKQPPKTPTPDESEPLILRFSQNSGSKAPADSRQSLRSFLDNRNDPSRNPSTANLRYPGGLDFERVVNNFSVEASRERYLVPLDDSNQQSRDSIREHENELYTPTGYKTFEEEHTPSSGSINSLTSTDDLLAPAPPPPLPALRGKVMPRRKVKPRSWGSMTGRTATGWILSVLTGLLTGSLAILLASQTERLREYRSELLDNISQSGKRGIYVFLVFAGSNLFLALLSSILCLYLCPNAIGSGIPEVKAYLNGVRVQRFSSFRLLVVKIVGTILSVSTDLAIGPEGPLVQLGAIIGASMTKIPNFLCRYIPPSAFGAEVWKFITMDLSHFSTDEERLILVSIGCAAGFAAAFGAPIGGLLFSMEEASTYFEIKIFVKTLTATVVGTFLMSVYHGDLSKFSIISLGDFNTPNNNIFLNRVEEIPLYLLMGVAGGVMGGLFCIFWKEMQLWRKSFFPSKKAQNRWRLKEVTFVSLLTSALMYYLPELPIMRWSCRDAAPEGSDRESDVFDAYISHSKQFSCPNGQINELGTIFFGNREDAIEDILGNPAQFHPRTLWTTGFLFFFLMTLTLGVALPSGIFMPTFLIGTSLGGASGLLFRELISEELAPATFALLGAAALLAGIQRTTVSVCVILVEGTGQVKTLIPCILTVMVAKYVGDRISGRGLYELAMEINRYPYLEPGEKKVYDIFCVKDIMSFPVITLSTRERAHTIVRLLRESVHNGFPVIDRKTKRFMGLVRRDQLVALLEMGVFEQASDDSEGDTSGTVRRPRNERLKSWKGPSGWGSSPNYHLAYHIKPDRYSTVESADLPLADDTDSKGSFSTLVGADQKSSSTNQMLEADEYDENAWFIAARRAREQMETQQPQGIVGSARNGVEDSMPLAVKRDSAVLPLWRTLDGQRSPTPGIYYKNAATVGLNHRGNVYVNWLNPKYENYLVPVGDVMNLGSYTVPEHMPVSKAYSFFTALGLRHLVVLGGETGGEVVGILSRINFLDSYIEERTGCENLLRNH